VCVGTGRDAKDVAFCTIFGPVRMTNKLLTVREYQDENAPPTVAPTPTGTVVGIEKPVPVTVQNGDTDGSLNAGHAIAAVD